MGKFHKLACYCLGVLGLASASFPAVASKLSVDVSPTTGYTVTNRTTTALPPRTITGPITTYNPTLGPLAGGGAYQTTSSGITITGINGGTASTTMSGRINAGAAAMRNGLTRCLTSARCNFALMAGGAGIQALFNGIDWIMEEGGQIKRKIPGSYDQMPDQSGLQSLPWKGCNGCRYENAQILGWTSRAGAYWCSHTLDFSGVQHYLKGYVRSTHDSSGHLIDAGMCFYQPEPFVPQDSFDPVPPADIASGVDSNYVPAPSDLPYISTGGLDFGAPDVNFEITDIPSATSDSSTFTEYPDGTSKGSTTQFHFNWSNNPSKQPQISVDETTTETTYSETGQSTGTTTTTTTTTATGGGQPPTNDIEIPTDCDFMPTVCRFLEWFQEPDPELQQEPDFNQLIDDVDIDRDYQVGSSTASCPAPFEISLSWVPSVSVSLQPFCDFADLMRPFYLSLCFLFSGMIILRT